MGSAWSCGSAAATQPPANGAPVAAPTATATAPADAAPHTTPAATVTGSSSTATTITTTTKGSTAPAADSAAATVSDASTANATTNGVTISAPISLATIVTADNASTAAVPTPTVARAKVAVVYYSTWGHLRALAESVAKGARDGGADVTLYQIAETLPAEVLTKMHAPPAPTDIPTMTADLLPAFDGFLFGAPTRYGQPSAQFKALWDSTGQLWAQGALDGKLAGFFFGTATLGGGQETTAWSNMGHFVHHGMLFVPMGYGDPNKPLFNNDVVHGGSPWGAGTLSGGDGSRKPSAMELDMGEYEGKRFAGIANAMVRGKGV